MSKNDVRKTVIDRLEDYCKEHCLKFTWAIERRLYGALTVHFSWPEHPDRQPVTYRITHNEITNAQGNADIVVRDTIVKIESLY